MGLEQETDSRKFIKQDNYVDWKDKTKILGKYYYVFKQMN